MEAKFCLKCGASIPENSKFCLSCGANLSAITSQSDTSAIESPPKTQPINVVSSDVTDLEIAAARNKSYTGIAIIVFFLYFLFYFPGLAANGFFYQEAKKMEEKAGTKLPGVNLLVEMMYINAIAIILTVVISIFIFGGFLLLFN